MMYSFLILYLLLSILNGLVMKNKQNIIGCGLVGFYPKKNKKVNLQNLLLLGIMNETRGEDSCGIAIGTERLIGTKTESVARNFIANNMEELHNMNSINKPCIFHTRRSTIGAHTEDNAHPFVYEHYDNENEKDVFVIAHNGIIKNTIELKTKFLSNLENSVKLLQIDTHYIALSLAFNVNDPIGERNVLESYDGNAALIYYNDSKFKVWKGGANNIEERPMFFIEANEGWYFCSIDTSLKIVFNNKYTITSLMNNELLTFSNNKLEKSEIIDRKFNIPYTAQKHINQKALWGAYQSKGDDDDYYTGEATFILPKFSIVQNCYIDESKRYPISGTHYGYSEITDNSNKTYSIYKKRSAHATKLILFNNGALVKDYMEWGILKSKFNKILYPTIDMFFNGEKKRIEKVLIDFLPLYNGKAELIMIIYKDISGKSQYISVYDKKTINIRLAFGHNDITVMADGTEFYIDSKNYYNTSKVV